MNRKIKRTMLESKAQYFGSLALIIISCLLFTMINQLSGTMESIVSSFEKNYVQEDASFIADRKLSNISDLETTYHMRIEQGESFDYPVAGDKTLRVFAETTKVNLYAMIEGGKLSGNDILLDPAYAKANGIRIGDSVSIYDQTFKVSGTMSLPHYIYPLKKESDLLNDSHNFGIAVISKNDFARFQKGSGFYSVKYEGDQAEAEQMWAAFKNELKNRSVAILKWTDITENPRVTVVTAKMDNMNKIGPVIPVAILLLTCILAGVVMWRMLKRESVIIGTLYALGYRKSEIMRHYLMYPLIISLAGGIIGTVLGALTLQPMLDFMVSYFNMPIDSVSYSVGIIAASLLMPVLFLMCCGYFVVNRALKHTPVELMRGGNDKNKIGFIERKVRLDKLNFSTKFKIRELLRSVPRSVFLLLGVTLATMLLLFGLTMKSSIDFLTKDTYEAAYKYKQEYVFNSFQQKAPAQGEPFSMAPFLQTSDDKKAFIVYGIRPDSKSIHLEDKAGHPLSFDNVIVTKPLADRLNIKAGDRIDIIGKLDSRTYTIPVDRIADTYTGEFVYMPIARFNEMMKYPEDSYLGIWSTEKADIPENALLSSSTIDEMTKAFDTLTEPMQAMLGAISFLSFIIGLIVIYVVTSLIIEENKSNISLMKVLGYRKKEVFSLILNSSAYVVVLGYIIGVPLVLVSLKAMYRSVAESTSIVMPVKMNYAYVIACFVVIYLVYEISKLLSRKKINNISLTDALKSRAE